MGVEGTFQKGDFKGTIKRKLFRIWIKADTYTVTFENENSSTTIGKPIIGKTETEIPYNGGYETIYAANLTENDLKLPVRIRF